MAEVAAEERFDTLPTVFGGLGIVSRLHRADSSDPWEKPAVAAHEAVARIVVELHVVIDAHLGEQFFEPAAMCREYPVLTAVAAKDRAYTAQLLGGLGHVAVKRRGDAQRSARREHQGESAAHAKADDSDARGVNAGLLLHKFARRVEVADRVALAAIERHHSARDTHEAETVAVVEVGRERAVAEVGDPSGDSPDVVVEAEDFVDDDYAGMFLGIGRRGVRSAHRAAGGGGGRNVSGCHWTTLPPKLPRP